MSSIYLYLEGNRRMNKVFANWDVINRWVKIISINKSYICTAVTLAVLAAFIPWAETLAVLFLASGFLAIASLDTWVFMTEGDTSSDHDLVDGLGSDVCEIFIVLAAVAVASLAERTYLIYIFTLREALTVKFQALWLFAVTLCYHGLVRVLHIDGHFVGFFIPMVARRIDGLIDYLQDLRRGRDRRLVGLFEPLEHFRERSEAEIGHRCFHRNLFKFEFKLPIRITN